VAVLKTWRTEIISGTEPRAL